MELCYVRAWVQTKGLLFPGAPVWDRFGEGPKTLSHHLPGPRDHHPLKQGLQGWARGGQGMPHVVPVHFESPEKLD